MKQFTLFFDGKCPLCVAEMKKLTGFDKDNKLNLIDIQQANFNEQYPDIDKNQASAILHAIDQKGELLLGLDATYHAWRQVNRHAWLVILRWPVIRFFADKAYLFFAKNRYQISKLFTGKAYCQQCDISNRKDCN
ncbi:DUF393 domain-containing protein [Catenovulum sp. SM1970]|uniref:thiol-disulfide oxidoreductase DCC family protein n=1 Tax=Marinifaba aquimaris TaxID=2741323 RepID=UPI001573C102|nr:DUF393 domain-containing protein [Marinifaba aquimaris]NTS75432.1 DUF393 domain-containing protein [Marinifaba aquimaris]